MSEIILILGYDEDVNKDMLDKVIKEQVYENFNELHCKNTEGKMYNLIKQCMDGIEGDTLVYPDFILSPKDLQAFYTVMENNYTVNIIQFINDWNKDKYSANEYNNSIFYAGNYCDSIYMVNTTTGFYKNFSDHILEVRWLCDILSNKFKHNLIKHDSDKIFNEEINKCYETYYPELKKIPYYDENSNRNKEYLDYEDEYMRDAMSKHVIDNTHHYYDWKNFSTATILDLIEAFIDVYSSIIINTKEPLELEKFIDIIKKKGMLIDVEEMICNTIRDLGAKTNESLIIRYNRGKHVLDRVKNGNYKRLRGKEAIDWIKEKNDYFYINYVVSYINYIQLITFAKFDEETGMFVNEDLKRMNCYLDLYYNEETNDVRMFATPIDDSLDEISI